MLQLRTASGGGNAGAGRPAILARLIRTEFRAARAIRIDGPTALPEATDPRKATTWPMRNHAPTAIG